ncbi:hypothetical protein ANO11243_010150 [Dothideomycetidae sp. 11243]|nr:hypothetical protein ANO11243_010150 [fungal sp. No.11243]
MQYHQYMIHAHRAWMSRSYIQPTNPPQGPGPGHARQTCLESALAIAKLIQLYEVRYSLRRMTIQAVPITCFAAQLLIFATVSKYVCPPGYDLSTQLSACFRALDDFSAAWESAKRARQFLMLLQRRWTRHGTSSKARRASQALPPESISAKRHRMGSSSVFSDLSAVPSAGLLPSNSNGAADFDMGLDLDWGFTWEGIDMLPNSS